MPHFLGVPLPHLMGWAVIVFELLSGLSLLVGAFVPLVSISMAAILLVRMYLTTTDTPDGLLELKGRCPFRYINTTQQLGPVAK
jgi:uncharacterized membrane protein YphA (DoxX/SURF4 family)